MHVSVTDRRSQEGPPRCDLARETERRQVGSQVPQPQRLRDLAQVLPQLRPVGQIQEPLVLPGGQAGRDELLELPRTVHGRDPAGAGAGQRASAFHDLAQDGVDVEALAAAQAGLAQL